MAKIKAMSPKSQPPRGLGGSVYLVTILSMYKGSIKEGLRSP